MRGVNVSFLSSYSDSGVKILTEAMPHMRSIALGFWINIGTRNEADNLGGISHFIEHMLFKGSKKYSSVEISQTFESLGADLNAFSSKEYVCFYSRFHDKHLPIALDVHSDMLQNPLLKEKDIGFEKNVVIEEINLLEDTPDELIHDLFASTIFQNHPLGKNVLGDIGSVKSFNQSNVSNFFNKNYVTKNILVAAAGNLEHEKIVDLINTHFLSAKRDENKKERHEFEPEIHQKLVVRSRKTEQAHICYGTKAIPAKHPDRFPLAVLDVILGGGMSSRLFQEIREKRGLVYTVYSYHSLFSDTGLFSVYAGTRASKVEEVIKIIQDELIKLLEKGINPGELDLAREHLKGQLVLSLESTHNRMIRIGKSELVHGEILSLDEIVKRIDEVTFEDVQRVARYLFKPEKMVLTIIGPTKEENITPLMERFKI